MRRQLNNVSSLLAVAQSVFDSVRQIQRSYASEIEDKKTNEHDFLSQPINSETLAAYTKWKYPELPMKPHIQELLIRDLDQGRFETLGDIDRAVNAASDVVESYRRENPGGFTSGTDFVTKSLGFFDEGFRDKHPFGPTTREAFGKYLFELQNKRSDG